MRGDYHCTEEEVRAMLRDANDSGCDGNLLNGYTMDDIDESNLAPGSRWSDRLTYDGTW